MLLGNFYRKGSWVKIQTTFGAAYGKMYHIKNHTGVWDGPVKVIIACSQIKSKNMHFNKKNSSNCGLLSFTTSTIGQLKICLLFTLLFVFSCSSDPCEEVTCLNGGVCSDGTCDCPEGWTGGDCSVFDFNYVGTYTAETLTFADCNSSSEEGSLSANADDRFCFSNANNGQNCSRLVLELNADGSALFIIVNTVISGGFESSSPTRISGSYTTDNEAIVFTDTGGNTTQFTVNEDRTGIDWLEATVASTGCNLIYTFIK